MKVAFIIPPVVSGEFPAERSSGCTRVVYPTPNIYELQLAACVREAGHEVVYWDCVNHPCDMASLQDRLIHENPDVCCFWTVNLSVENDIEVIRQIHQRRPEIWMMMVGPGAGYYHTICHVDERVVVVHGEPELTCLDLLSCWEAGKEWKNVLGISFLDGNRERRTQMRPLMKDLDSLPVPARDLVADTVFRNPKLKVTPYATMVTSRNCPFRCIYCVPSSLTFAREMENREFYGRKPAISYRSVEKVAEEIHQLHSEGIKAIGFMDDNFIWNEKRTSGIAEALKECGIVWGCQARVDAISEPIAQILGESGCRYVDLGVESFDEKILDYIHKGIKPQQIYHAIDLLKRYKVPVKLNILIGTSPLETEESIRFTMAEARRLDVDQVMINIVSPFPGTEFYTIAKQNGWIKNEEYRPTDVQKESILSYPHLSSERMEKLLWESNLHYFLSPKFVWKQVRQFRSISDFVHAFKSLVIKLSR